MGELVLLQRAILQRGQILINPSANIVKTLVTVFCRLLIASSFIVITRGSVRYLQEKITGHVEKEACGSGQNIRICHIHLSSDL